MPKAEHRDLRSPDETRTFEKGKLQLVTKGDGTVGPVGLTWRWPGRKI